MPDRLLTARDVSRLLGVVPATVLRWARDDDLPAIRLPSGQIRFRPEAIEAWLAGRGQCRRVARMAAASRRMRHKHLVVLASRCYGRAMTKSSHPTKPVPIRIPVDMVTRIDAVKDPLIPREAFVRHLLEQALQAEERKAKKTRR
jgi:excisionase family DNA binding protein